MKLIIRTLVFSFMLGFAIGGAQLPPQPPAPLPTGPKKPSTLSKIIKAPAKVVTAPVKATVKALGLDTPPPVRVQVSSSLVSNCTVTSVPNGSCPGCVDLVLAPGCPASSIFVNAAAGDFHLVAGAPPIGLGTCIGAVPTDKDGNPRPTPGGSGTGCDIGAYQYTGSSSGPPTKPPKNLRVTP